MGRKTRAILQTQCKRESYELWRKSCGYLPGCEIIQQQQQQQKNILCVFYLIFSSSYSSFRAVPTPQLLRYLWAWYYASNMYKPPVFQTVKHVYQQIAFSYLLVGKASHKKKEEERYTLLGPTGIYRTHISHIFLSCWRLNKIYW